MGHRLGERRGTFRPAELSVLRRVIGADDVILGAAGADDVADGETAANSARQTRELADVDVPSRRTVFIGGTGT